MKQLAAHVRDNQAPPRQSVLAGNGMPSTHPPQSCTNTSQSFDHSLNAKNSVSSTKSMQMQYLKQINRSPHAIVTASEQALGSHIQLPGASNFHASQQRFGFTKQQLHVLKAQTPAFRLLKLFDRKEKVLSHKNFLRLLVLHHLSCSCCCNHFLEEETFRINLGRL